MSFETCEWFNKEKEKISLNIPYFDVIKEDNDNIFFSNAVHYKSNTTNTPLKIKFNKLKITNYEDKLKKLNDKKNKILTNNKFKKESIRKSALTKVNKEITNYNKIIKSRTYQIYPNSKQRKILFSWMEECTKIYNYCVNLYNVNPNNINLDYTKMKLDVFNNYYGENDKPAPYDILTDEVRAFCSNIKSCLTNLKNNNIKHFTITNKNTTHCQSIIIPIKSINKKGIFTSLLKNMVGFKNINIDNINGDSRLIYDKINKKFYLKCPRYFDIKTVNNRKEIVALDPGEKIFMTYYSFNNCGMIGHDIKNNILKYESKIRKIQRSLTNKKIRNKKKLKKTTT